MRTATTILTITVLLVCGLSECPAADPPGPPPLKVVGTHLTTPDGKVARLRGVNLPTLEWGPKGTLYAAPYALGIYRRRGSTRSVFPQLL